MNSLIAPIFGLLHITTALGVAIAPPVDKVRYALLHGLQQSPTPVALHPGSHLQAATYQKCVWGAIVSHYYRCIHLPNFCDLLTGSACCGFSLG